MNGGKYSSVKTYTFVDTILAQCKSRGDEWAISVQGRIEYFSGDLHAADSLYHHCCDVNFRTGREVLAPMQDKAGPSSKRKNLGRPKDLDQEQAFLRMCHFFEENDDEQFTVSDLANKMDEYLQDKESSSYGNQYLKSMLLSKYGDSLLIADSDGRHDVVTFRKKTSHILRRFFDMPNKDDDEAHKKTILETAAEFIKNDIKTSVSVSKDEYPKATDLSLESSLRYLPESLRILLQHLCVGQDTRRKQASIGQAIV